eukprot:4672972-Alexandrium_andersonii.AAC.1
MRDEGGYCGVDVDRICDRSSCSWCCFGCSFALAAPISLIVWSAGTAKTCSMAGLRPPVTLAKRRSACRRPHFCAVQRLPRQQ